MWWDKLKYLFERTNRENVCIRLNGDLLQFDLQRDRAAAFEKVWQHCLNMTEEERAQLTDWLEAEMEVEVPPAPTKGFWPVTWSQLKEMAHNGVEIGSHTVNHVSLSRIDGDRAAWELGRSKEKLQQILGTNVVSFCYPYGTVADVNRRVCEAVRQMGYWGAVLAYSWPDSQFDSYRIPRMAVGHDKVDFLWKLCGMEQACLRLRAFLGAS